MKLIEVLAPTDPAIFSTYNLIGWIISSVICVFITVFIYPYLDNKFQSFVVRELGALHISSKHKLSGHWTHTWHVISDSFPKENVVNSIEIKQFRNRIFAQYQVLDNKNKIYTYQMLGRIKNDQVITGTWRDIESGNRYYGCFQLFIDINENNLSGYWTGVSNKERIKSDKWEWSRE